MFWKAYIPTILMLTDHLGFFKWVKILLIAIWVSGVVERHFQAAFIPRRYSLMHPFFAVSQLHVPTASQGIEADTRRPMRATRSKDAAMLLGVLG